MMLEKRTPPKTVAFASICLNMIIFSVKFYIGTLVGSLALISDSFHTLSDSLSSMAVFLGVKISEKPPDKKHPYGHGRADLIALMVVGILLIFAALNFLVDGITSLLAGPQEIYVERLFFTVIVFTAILKLVMGELSYKVGSRYGVESLKADAWHHRSDALTTFLVLFTLYGAQIGFPVLDTVAGIMISLVVGYIGLSYLKKTTDRLLGRAPSDELVDDIKKRSEDMAGIHSVHGITVHDYGDRMAISLHMVPEPGTSNEAHRTAHELTDFLKYTYKASVNVHLDPWGVPEDRIKALISEMIESNADPLEVHKIDLMEGDSAFFLLISLTFPVHMNLEEATGISERIEKESRDLIFHKTGIKFDVSVIPKTKAPSSR